MTQDALSRRDILRFVGAAGAAVLLPTSLFAQRGQDGKPLKSPVPSFDVDPIKVEEIGHNLFLISGIGGNITLKRSSDGGLMVDSGVPTRAKELIRMAQKINGGRVATLVNTHHHFDHTGGNEEFGLAHARIIAQAGVRPRLSSDQVIELINLKVPASPKAALPTLSFTESLRIELEDTGVHLRSVEPAHTDNDLFVVYESENLIQTGDLFFNGVYPLIDFSSGGWIGGMVAGIDAVIRHSDEKTRIVPGHGGIGKVEDAKVYREMLATIHQRIEGLLGEGKTLEQVVAAKPSADFDAHWGHGLFNGDAFVSMATTGILRHKAAKGS